MFVIRAILLASVVTGLYARAQGELARPALPVADVEFTIQLVAQDDTKEPLVQSAAADIEHILGLYCGSKVEVTTQGSDRLIVRLASLKEVTAAEIKEVLENKDRFELREVSARNEETSQNWKTIADRDKTLAQRVAESIETAPDGCEIFQFRSHSDKSPAPILLAKQAFITGKDVARAEPSPQHNDAVDITLSEKGGDKMTAATKNMTPGTDRIAILINHKVIWAPRVNAVPLGRDFEIICGLTDSCGAKRLAASLSLSRYTFKILDIKPLPQPDKP